MAGSIDRITMAKIWCPAILKHLVCFSHQNTLGMIAHFVPLSVFYSCSLRKAGETVWKRLGYSLDIVLRDAKPLSRGGGRFSQRSVLGPHLCDRRP